MRGIRGPCQGDCRSLQPLEQGSSRFIRLVPSSNLHPPPREEGVASDGRHVALTLGQGGMAGGKYVCRVVSCKMPAEHRAANGIMRQQQEPMMDRLQPIAAFVARLALAWIFLLEGVTKLGSYSATAAYM